MASGRTGRVGGGVPSAPGPATRGASPPTADVDPADRARETCLRLLTVRPRSRQELAVALRRRGVPDDVAAAVLTRFSEVGLVDDRAFAEAWVDSRVRGRGLGRRALEHELRQKGVGRQEAAEALAGLTTDSELDTAVALAVRKAGATRGRPPEVRARRLVGMLARRGYSHEVALTAAREALARDGEAGETVERLLPADAAAVE